MRMYANSEKILHEGLRTNLVRYKFKHFANSNKPMFGGRASELGVFDARTVARERERESWSKAELHYQVKQTCKLFDEASS